MREVPVSNPTGDIDFFGGKPCSTVSYISEKQKGEVNTRMCGDRQGFNNNLLAFPYHYFRHSDHPNLSMIVRILERNTTLVTILI